MFELIIGFLWFLLFFGGGIFLAYQRVELRLSTAAAGIAVAAYVVFGNGYLLWKLFLIAAFGAILVLNLIEQAAAGLLKDIQSNR